jgi:urease accessory protein
MLEGPRPDFLPCERDLDASIAFLRCLQLSDSALPIGRYVHSLGLEALLEHDQALDSEGLCQVVQSFISEGVARLDAVAVAEAHRHLIDRNLERLLALDRVLTARKLSQAARRASQTCGGQLAALATSLVTDPVLNSFCGAIRAGESVGNLAVVEGAFAASLGLPPTWAVMIELRGAAASMLSAAVRLGRLSAMRAQHLLTNTETVIARAAAEAMSCSVSDMCSSAIELEIHAMRHARAQSKLFMT